MEGWSSTSYFFDLGTYTCFHYTWQPKTIIWNILFNLCLPAKIKKYPYDRLYRKSVNMTPSGLHILPAKINVYARQKPCKFRIYTVGVKKKPVSCVRTVRQKLLLSYITLERVNHFYHIYNKRNEKTLNGITNHTT